ncbi:GGDEF domain-containing protein [Cellulomonas fimi]|uniref:GGDEF domain-containing protein n=1 Tax=Cellulomonas fimi TaxID=1708 RepID=A0A7Y0LVG2_CELFI|nr:GGDEF domain-containing protein [Cellulomonas fimi]NMR18957.1 GGDEF domain-containing protein [Cellulomonas fimi]
MRAVSAVPTHAVVTLTAALLAVVTVLTDGLVREAVHVVAILVPATVVLGTLARRRIRPAQAWWVAFAALLVLLVNSVGSLVPVGTVDAAQGEGPLRVIALPLGYVLLLVAAYLVLRPFLQRDGGRLVEAAIVSLGSASVLWTVIAQPALDRAAATTAARTYALVIVMIMSTIAGMVLRTAATHPAARPALAYLSVATLALLAGNAGRILLGGPDPGSGDRAIDLAWVVGYGALAAGLVHPSSVALGEPGPSRDGALGTHRLTFLGLVLLVNPLVAAVQEATGGNADWLLLALVTSALVPLVVVRIAHLARLQAAAQDRLTQLVTHDELTGLLNRSAVLAHLDEALDRARRRGAHPVIVVFLDVDGLKAANDAHGHRAGDALLVSMARRLGRALGPRDAAARLGGDEFLVVCEGPAAMLAGTVRRIRDAVSQPVVHGGVMVSAGASVGVVEIAAGASTRTEDVIAAADAQMYADKRHRYGDAVRDRRAPEPVI